MLHLQLYRAWRGSSSQHSVRLKRIIAQQPLSHRPSWCWWCNLSGWCRLPGSYLQCLPCANFNKFRKVQSWNSTTFRLPLYSPKLHLSSAHGQQLWQHGIPFSFTLIVQGNIPLYLTSLSLWQTAPHNQTSVPSIILTGETVGTITSVSYWCSTNSAFCTI